MFASHGGVMQGTGTIKVKYRFMYDYHIFTSKDVYGLYVASRDPQKALAAVPGALRALVKANEGVDCDVEVAKSFRDWIDSNGAPEPADLERAPPVLEDKQYAIRRAA